MNLSKAHAFLLLGGLEGVDGYVDSAGMMELIPMLKAIGVETTVHDWEQYAAVLPELGPGPGVNLLRIVIGYSGGGSRATWLANLPQQPRIDLMVLYDPSPSWQMEPIGSNVLRAVCYHNLNPMMPSPFGMLGGGILTIVKGATTKIETVSFSEQHLLVQFNTDLHRRTIAEVQKLLA